MNGKKLILPILAVVLCLGIVGFLAASSGTEEQPTKITVSAAASLTEAFTDIAKEFEAAHPGTKVELNLAGSGTLRTHRSNQGHLLMCLLQLLRATWTFYLKKT